MARWIECHVCGCTGVHYNPEKNRHEPCPNNCDHGRIYEDKNPAWFACLAKDGRTIQSDESRGPRVPEPGTQAPER